MITTTATSPDLDQARRWIDGPAWRWRSADDISRSLRVPNDGIDEHVSRAARYLRVLNADDDGPSRADCAHPVVGQARALWNDRDLREKLVIMVLGDLSRDAIAKRLRVSAEVIETAEVLFLDVRGSRAATDWIDCHIVRRELRSGSVDAGVRYRMAFRGGPKVAERILDCTDPRWLFQLTSMAAVENPMTTAKESLQVLRAQLELEVKSERLKLERKKLRMRAEQESRRLALAEERMKLRAKKDEEKERRQHLAALKMSLRKKFAEAEQVARITRAQNSPLAALTWKSNATAVSPRTGDSSAPRDTVSETATPSTAQRRTATSAGRRVAGRLGVGRNGNARHRTGANASTPVGAAATSETAPVESGNRELQDSLVEA